MNLLPHWVLTDKFPAFYDSESKTAIEQTARVYGAMQTLITEYNAFVDSVNQHITDFENAAVKNYEEFTTGIRQEFQDFIDVIDLKVKSQDAAISDAVDYMKTNLSASINAALTELRESGGFSREVMKVYSDMLNQIAVLNSRMNTFTSLEEGSTTGDAELEDAHVDYTGKEWDNVGEHIRGVSSQLSSELGDVKGTLHEQTIKYDLAKLKWQENTALQEDGQFVVTTENNRLTSAEYVYITAGTKIKIKEGYRLRYVTYSDVDLSYTNQFTMIESVSFPAISVTEYTIPYDAFVRFSIAKGENYDPISVNEITSIFIESIANYKVVSCMLHSNLLENVSITNGIYLSSSGDTLLGRAMCTTDYIPVYYYNLYALDILTKVAEQTTSLYSRICCYDDDKQFIEVIGRMSIGTSSSNEVTKIYKILSIPENCSYIRISYPFMGVDTITISGYSSADQIARQSIYKQDKEIKKLNAEKYALKRNNPDMVAEMISIAESYKNRKNENGFIMHYGVNTPLSTTYNNDGAIDCSTFIGFVLRGIRFENSPYLVDYDSSDLNPFDPTQFVANPECAWSINPLKYEYDLVQDVNQPEYAEARRASQLAQMFAEQGREIPLDKYLNNLEVGDILFFSAKNEDGSYKNAGRYRNITHIALLIDVSEAPLDATWDTEKYPYAHTCIDVSASGNTDPVVIRVLESRPMLDTAQSMLTLSCAFRPDLGCITSSVIDGKKLIFNNDGTVTWELIK